MIDIMRKMITGIDIIQISKLTKEVDMTVYNDDMKNEADICQK